MSDPVAMILDVTRMTLAELNGSVDYDPPTSLIERCMAARRLPICRLDAGSVQLLLSQGCDVNVLLPLSACILEAEPLLEARHYPGDLLEAALRALAEYDLDRYTATYLTVKRILSVAERGLREIKRMEDDLTVEIIDDLEDVARRANERHAGFLSSVEAEVARYLDAVKDKGSET